MPYEKGPPNSPADDTIGHLVEHAWRIAFRCSCGHESSFAQEKLKTLPQGATVREVATRARCSACGTTDIAWWMVLNDNTECSRRNLERTAEEEAAKAAKVRARGSP